MVSLSKLNSKEATAAKGAGKAKPRAKADAPPSLNEASEITKNPPRDKKETMVPMQFMVPESVAETFAQIAARDCGYKKGAKSQLFLRMFEAYRTSTDYQ